MVRWPFARCGDVPEAHVRASRYELRREHRDIVEADLVDERGAVGGEVSLDMRGTQERERAEQHAGYRAVG